jgi:hypothetical protein
VLRKCRRQGLYEFDGSFRVFSAMMRDRSVGDPGLLGGSARLHTTLPLNYSDSMNWRQFHR